MHRFYWRYGPPLGVIVFVAAMLSLAALNSHDAQSINHDAATSAPNQTTNEKQQPTELVLKRNETGAKAKPDDDRSERDLQAQERMAFWAMLAVIVAGFIGVATTLVTAVGVYYVKDTLEATRQNVELLGKSNEISQDQFIADRRPWLCVTNATLTGEFEVSEHGVRCEIDFEIENVGKSPALRVWATIQIYSPIQMNRAVMQHAHLRASEQDLFGETIFPGKSSKETSSGAGRRYEALEIGPKQTTATHFMVAGFIEYRDPATKRLCKTPVYFNIKRIDGKPIVLRTDEKIPSHYLELFRSNLVGNPT